MPFYDLFTKVTFLFTIQIPALKNIKVISLIPGCTALPATFR